MSYTLDFPRQPLPPNILSPPYAIFAIRGVEVFTIASRIPLSVILHFAPKFKIWVLPPPLSPPPSRCTSAQRSCHLLGHCVGIDIQANIRPGALSFILNRMLQAAGSPLVRDNFPLYPSITDSANIISAWRELELPPSGISGLETHLRTRLMLGPFVTAAEIQAIWAAYPHPTTSPVAVEMVHNFIRSYIDGEYAKHESADVKTWLAQDPDRSRFFCSFEEQYKKEGERDEKTLDPRLVDMVKKIEDTIERLPRPGTGRLKARRSIAADFFKNETLQEKRERVEKEAKERARRREARRLRRLASDDSISSVETVRPDPEKEAEEESMAALMRLSEEEGTSVKGLTRMVKSLRESKPVDSGMLSSALEKLGLGRDDGE